MSVRYRLSAAAPQRKVGVVFCQEILRLFRLRDYGTSVIVPVSNAGSLEASLAAVTGPKSQKMVRPKTR